MKKILITTATGLSTSLAFFKAKNKDQSFMGKTEYVFFTATELCHFQQNTGCPRAARGTLGTA